MSTTLVQNDEGRLLTFKQPTTLEGLGHAATAYNDLVHALTGREPSYTDFTSFLEREGYVE